MAQAAHATGCAMGVVPQGTFNYFARTHGIPVDPTEAVSQLLRSTPVPVQVAGINDHLELPAFRGHYSEVSDKPAAFFPSPTYV